MHAMKKYVSTKYLQVTVQKNFESASLKNNAVT